jgi:hypothetical protein
VNDTLHTNCTIGSDELRSYRHNPTQREIGVVWCGVVWLLSVGSNGVVVVVPIIIIIDLSACHHDDEAIK